MNVQTLFNKKTEDVKQLPFTPDNDDLLKLYGFYKQVKEGDINTAQPYAIQVHARAKWEAWNKNKGLDKITAMKNYIYIVNQLQHGNKN